MDAETPFKVIIIGAGVTGLTLAHCLAKAGIDYVLLDKGVVAPPFGTTITMQPHGCRILHQLGCLDSVLNTTSIMGGAYCRDPSGSSYTHNDFFGVVRANAGYDTRTIDRQQFLQILYEHLPDQSKVYQRARVEGVTEENSKVHVRLADGKTFTGDLVVGADGVHSMMREIMWEKANSAVPGMIPSQEKREDQQCTWPTRRKYTEADMEKLAAKLAGYPINETVVFGELWKNKIKAQMISLEEGSIAGQTGLTQDDYSSMQVTPNSALGGNTAMEDAVVIANALHGALAAHPSKKPTDVEIRDAMQQYQDSRIGRVRAIVKAGGDLTRLQAYDGWKFYMTQRWLTPLIGLDRLAMNIAVLCAGAPKLSYVQFDEQRGRLGWQDTLAAAASTSGREEKHSAWGEWPGDFESASPKIFGALGVLSVAIWAFLLAASHSHVPGFGRYLGPISLNATSSAMV
ncbi:hypothetical protein SLS62_000849 [Diatrype stigma]|uniref:FAD-binding domain-containing protein n=1 Tax=Diatrype stigma TaxID=117547 RepID=A0AAN9UXB4_9PEZI